MATFNEQLATNQQQEEQRNEASTKIPAIGVKVHACQIANRCGPAGRNGPLKSASLRWNLLQSDASRPFKSSRTSGIAALGSNVKQSFLWLSLLELPFPQLTTAMAGTTTRPRSPSRHRTSAFPALAIVLVLVLAATIISSTKSVEAQQTCAGWQLLTANAGVSAMQVALMPNDKIVIWDYAYSSHASNITLPKGQPCIQRVDAFHPRAPIKEDCWAHSVEFDPATGSVRPLTLYTDTWCSGGALSVNGTLVQNGGWADGGKTVRTYSPCDTCDWDEHQAILHDKRWYSTTQILADGRMIVFGGHSVFTYEFVPTDGNTGAPSVNMPFLHETTDTANPEAPNNLYPYVHLLPDGTFFIFANNRSIVFDHAPNRVVRTFPDMPGNGISRNYPSAGSSVMLPLNDTGAAGAVTVEVLVCGGTPSDSYTRSHVNNPNRSFPPADDTCGRITVFGGAGKPRWTIEKMPMRRAMGDMVLLPTGQVLIVNGVGAGSQGWEQGRAPVLTPVLYTPDAPARVSRFQTFFAACRPRVYHSVAHLLRDGRVLVGGSNGHQYYTFQNTEFPTDLSLEALSPPYLSGNAARPQISWDSAPVGIGYNVSFTMLVNVSSDAGVADVQVALISSYVTTHSYSMNQRMVRLSVLSLKNHTMVVRSPSSPNVAPRGYYMLFVVERGVPSVGSWVSFA